MNYTLAFPSEINGTGRVGTLFATYETIINRFGIAHSMIPTNGYKNWKFESDGKVRFEWAFKSVDKKAVITIHDYKNSEPADQITEWSIGGKGDKELIIKFFKQYFDENEFEIN